MKQNLSFVDMLPDPVVIPPMTLQRCRETGDFREILFEYYKNTAIFCLICSQITFESPNWKGSRNRWTVLVGLLTRCCRIMAGHLEYFQDGRYGDITLILDRSLLETCVKVRWISGDALDDRLGRYLEDSLRVDSELFSEIEKNIETRKGIVLPIEARMLKSIDVNAKFAGIDLSSKPKLRKAQSLADMIETIGEKRFLYTVIGKISSHAVHRGIAFGI